MYVIHFFFKYCFLQDSLSHNLTIIFFFYFSFSNLSLNEQEKSRKNKWKRQIYNFNE